MAAARLKGLFGVVFTDHCNIRLSRTENELANIEAAIKAANALKAANPDFTVIAGMELGEPLFCLENAKKATATPDVDMILLSVHRMQKYNVESFRLTNFAEFTKAQLQDYLTCYFNDLCASVNAVDFDVVAHLTVPLRYTAVKYGIPVDLNQYSRQIEDILKFAVLNGKAIEVNTSNCKGDFINFMPDAELLKKYYALGGRLVTVGSDAHKTENVGNRLKEAANMLKEIGFSEACYFKNRKPILYKL